MVHGTPIGNADGSKNFEGLTWEFCPGSEQQEYIKGIPSVDNEISISRELKDEQHDNGDTSGYRIDYAIDLSSDGSGYKEVLRAAFDGKTTSEYQRTHRIDLPAAKTGWQLRVRRLTPNKNTARIADKVVVAAITEVIDAKLRYPRGCRQKT